MKGIKYLLLALIIASLCFSCATTEMRSPVKNKQVQNKMNGQGEEEMKADENEWQK